MLEASGRWTRRLIANTYAQTGHISQSFPFSPFSTSCRKTSSSPSMPLLTQANWHLCLLSPATAYALRQDIIIFNAWSQIQSGGLPFLKIAWWSDGTCCVHSVSHCNDCNRWLGGQTPVNTSAADPPSEASFLGDHFWGPFMRRWGAGTMAEQQHVGGERQRSSISPQVRGINVLTPREICLPVYFSPPIHAHPEILPDEVYIFPNSSIRIMVEHEVLGFRQWVRLPDMSVRDLMKRLLGSKEGLWLEYRLTGAGWKWKKLDSRGASVFKEIARGANGESLSGHVMRRLSICRE